jgi:hypothetical protein
MTVVRRKTKRKREETNGVGVDVRAPAFPRTPLADGQVKRKSRLEEPLGGRPRATKE